MSPARHALAIGQKLQLALQQCWLGFRANMLQVITLTQLLNDLMVILCLIFSSVFLLAPSGALVVIMV